MGEQRTMKTEQKTVRMKFYAHVSRPGPRAWILRPCRHRRHMANFAMLLHSKKDLRRWPEVLGIKQMRLD